MVFLTMNNVYTNMTMISSRGRYFMSTKWKIYIIVSIFLNNSCFEVVLSILDIKYSISLHHDA